VLIRLRYAALSAAIVVFGAGVPAAITTGAVKVGYARVQGGEVPARSAPDSPPRQLIVPDLVAVVPAGITAAQVSAIGGLAGVRAVLAVAGGRVVIDGRTVSVLGVPPQAFRSWTPPATAADAAMWARLSGGELVASGDAAGGFGIPGVDAIVDGDVAGQLGLTAGVAVLINAPGADLAALMSGVRAVTGPGGTVRNLVPAVAVTSLPVEDDVPAGRPASWLDLYRESAARYCPGLSWTVLAAIGEIESGDGASNGPSSAGALGPMQFLPSTWRIWGTDGFGRAGPPDIMNPLDAVPSAARMLCAGGAASGGAALSAAIFGYNHATWYVSDVLALAGEYAQEYP
jgi:Transglycosylase SLT domain